MLENPYFTAQADLPAEPGLYLGDGRITEAEDGSWISIWWESNLKEAVDLNMRLQKKLGVWRVVRLAQVILLLFAAGSLLITIGVGLLGDEREFFMLFAILTPLFVVLAILKPIRFRKAVEKIVIQSRGTRGTMEVIVQIDPKAVRVIALDTETAFLWRSIEEVEVTKHGVTFIRQFAGFAHVPTRVFPNAQSMERFVMLAHRYAKKRTEQ